MILWLDREGKYFSGEFWTYLKDNGIVSQWTPLETPQLNEISKRRNRILLDMVWSMMSFTDLHVFLWGYVLLSVIHVLNRIFSKSVSIIPYELWHGKKPALGYLKIWGCPTYVKWQQTKKLEARSFRTHFIGYPKECMGYYFYLSKDHNVIVSRHTIFLKKEFIQDRGSGMKIELKEKVSEKHRV